jgi:signal transduction histidine kinase/predicted negative regulator of RcsB-dependent stress response
MNLKLDWQKRAILLFAVVLLIFSVILTVFAIREAERDKIAKQREINQELERVATSINSQVMASIRRTEELSFKLLDSTRGSLNETELKDVSTQIKESEKVVDEIFYIGPSGRIDFQLFKTLYRLDREADYSRKGPIAIENNPLFKSAETAEFKTRNYALAISEYRQLMRSTSDNTSRALLLNRIARCYKLSGNFDRAIQTYKQIVSDFQAESSSDGIPYAFIALNQMGVMYSDLKKDREIIETHLELYNNLLEPAWSISRTQFSLYLKKVKDELDSLRTRVVIENIDVSLADRWKELELIEKEKMDRMAIIETITQKMAPLSSTNLPEAEDASGTFFHLSEKTGNNPLLISYTYLDNQSLIGFILHDQYLKNDILPSILAKLPMKEGFIVQIADENDNVIAGKEISGQESPVPLLSYSRNFEEGFPPWMVRIYQSFPSEADRQFSLRRNIYVLSVVVVIIAILFGGILAIRSTAKELRLAKLKSEFVSTVSHEFRTPLTSIRYLAELLQRGRVKEESKKQQYYESITHESERLSRLIENILDFSKIEAGMKEYEFAETDVTEMCRDVVSRFQEQIAPQDFTVEDEISKELPKIFADKETLGRALYNLLDNAVKYSGESRKIKFRAWTDPSKIYLKVEDKGIGIGKENQDRVFEKFCRSGDVQNSSIKGSGIGLTLVSHIAKAHRGEVIIESELGEGTEVTIILPIDRKV